MVLMEKVYPKSIAEVISMHGVTCMMGLAPLYQTLLELLDHKTYDLCSLRVPESGGMYTRGELIERFRRKTGVPIIPVWGSTETTGIAVAIRPGGPLPPGSVGKPCFSYEVRIIDEQNRELPEGEIGEMIFKGPAVVEDYYQRPEESQKCFQNGWYYSGDFGKKDNAGNLYFIERKSGMMKVAGLKVYPLEVELSLIEHPAIQEVAIIAARDRLRGEVPKAIIVPKPGQQITEKEVHEFCREKLPHYKVPRIIEFREHLPKIGSGKINKRELQLEEISKP
jgi:long-chain acyl-CoA synthetase